MDYKGYYRYLCHEETKTKKDIVMFAGKGIMTAALITGIGLGIYDTKLDHRHEVCPICKVFSNINVPIQSGGFIGLGVLHQANQIEKECLNDGVDVYMKYYEDELGSWIIVMDEQNRHLSFEEQSKQYLKVK